MSNASANEREPAANRPPNMRNGQLASLVSAMCEAANGLRRPANECPNKHPLPSRDTIVGIIEDLRSVLFPGYFGPSELDADNLAFHMGSTLDRIRRNLREQIRRGFCFACDKVDCNESNAECKARTEHAVNRFLERLPAVRRVLATDVQVAYEGDPAARSPDEAIFCYPGVLAITNYRLAHELYQLGVPLIPRIVTEHAHSITGIDIHPGATIGESFFIDHGTGVVIGETCEIGPRVRLYQGVTLGAKSFPLDENGNPIKGIKRHPVVEGNVIIYSEATILGRVTVGRGSVIGGNVWLTRDVPPGSVITQAQARQDLFENGGGI
ncbi:MAG: serine O-acetyltransferase EpsC [Planctomycetota bacterium]